MRRIGLSQTLPPYNITNRIPGIKHERNGPRFFGIDECFIYLFRWVLAKCGLVRRCCNYSQNWNIYSNRNLDYSQ